MYIIELCALGIASLALLCMAIWVYYDANKRLTKLEKIGRNNVTN